MQIFTNDLPSLSDLGHLSTLLFLRSQRKYRCGAVLQIKAPISITFIQDIFYTHRGTWIFYPRWFWIFQLIETFCYMSSCGRAVKFICKTFVWIFFHVMLWRWFQINKNLLELPWLITQKTIAIRNFPIKSYKLQI